jgi:hypothetical protein
LQKKNKKITEILIVLSSKNDFSAIGQMTFPSPSFYDVTKEREMPTKVRGGRGK